MEPSHGVAITGIGLEIPGVGAIEELVHSENVKCCPDLFAPEKTLGKKGLRYKDRATKLALCAVWNALVDSGLPTDAGMMICGEEFGVVVSSNLGNLETVCKSIDVIRTEGTSGLSSMDLPNASSNVIAASIAIRFQMQALNLMLCNGTTSGVDAVYLGANSIRTRRADKVVVVGVETPSACGRKLVCESSLKPDSTEQELRLFDGAAAIILESDQSVRGRGAKVHGMVNEFLYTNGNYNRPSFVEAISTEHGWDPDIWFVPCSMDATIPPGEKSSWNDPGCGCTMILNIGGELGDPYGALGILQTISACYWLGKYEMGNALVSNGKIPGDGLSTLRVSRPAK